MLGAIIGDVAGSIYEVLEIEEILNNKRIRSYEERIKILDKNVPLFTNECSVTDDSILTCAIYDAIKNGNCNYEKYLREYGLREVNLGLDKYGRSRFGKGFVSWLNEDKQGRSYGNGAAMRVSSVGFCFKKLEDVITNSWLATNPTHNHEQAIIAAEAVATSIFFLKQGYSKDEVKFYVNTYYYDLDYDMEDLQRNNTFSSKASKSVPQALFVFFNSNSFEDAIRKAISIGGDSDTIAAIVGSLAEAHYGIPNKYKEAVKPHLNDYMYELLKDKYYSNNIVKRLRNK